MNEWIKCSERKPEYGVDVLVWHNGTFIVASYYEDTISWSVNYGDRLTVFDDDKWTALPEPPSEQAAEEKCNR